MSDSRSPKGRNPGSAPDAPAPKAKRKPRAIRPRPPIAVAPLAVSTETCLQLGGITQRKLRDALAAHPDIPRSRVGHTLVVEAEHFRELLERLRVGGDADEKDGEIDLADEALDDEAPETRDEILAALGKERVG